MRSANRRDAADVEGIAPVTILDGLGRVIRIVPAAEFRRAHGTPEQSMTISWRRKGERVKTIGRKQGESEADLPR